MNEFLTSPIAKAAVIVVVSIISLSIIAMIVYLIHKMKSHKSKDQLQSERFEQMIMCSIDNLITQKQSINEKSAIDKQISVVDANPINAVIKKLTAANLYIGSEGFLIEKGIVDKNSQIVKIKGGKFAVILTEFPSKDIVSNLIKRYDLILISSDDDKVYVIESLGNYIGDKLNFQL